MKRLSLVAAAAGLALSTSGCAGLVFQGRRVTDNPVAGPYGINSIYAKAEASERVTQNALGMRTGEACSKSILGLVTTGDSSVVTAARAGNVRRIALVDHRYESVLGLVSTYCVVVTGE